MFRVSLENGIICTNPIELRLPKRRGLPRSVLIAVGVATMAIVVFFASVISPQIFFTRPSTAYATSEALDQFVAGVEADGLSTRVIQKITRSPFTVPGTLLVVGGESMEAFAYPDHERATIDAAEFLKRYVKRTTPNPWKNSMHVYVRDTVVIVYMGTESNIISALKKDEAVLAVTQ